MFIVCDATFDTKTVKQLPVWKEQYVIGHYEASEARKVALCENKEKNGTKEGERDQKLEQRQNRSAGSIKR